MDLQLKDGKTGDDTAEALAAANDLLRDLLPDNFGPEKSNPARYALFRRGGFSVLKRMLKKNEPTLGGNITQNRDLLREFTDLGLIHIVMRGESGHIRSHTYELTEIGRRVTLVYDALTKLLHGIKE